MRGISSLYFDRDHLRSLTEGDSKPKLRGNATTRTANVRCIVLCGRVAASDPLSRSRDPRTRPALRKILAEAFSRRAADHGPALGGRSGVVRRWALSALQRHPEPAHHQ